MLNARKAVTDPAAYEGYRCRRCAVADRAGFVVTPTPGLAAGDRAASSGRIRVRLAAMTSRIRTCYARAYPARVTTAPNTNPAVTSNG